MSSVIITTGLIGIAAGFSGHYLLGSIPFALGILAIGIEIKRGNIYYE